MRDALIALLIVVQVAGIGACFWQLHKLREAVTELETGSGVMRVQVDSLLARTDRRLIAHEAGIVEEWRSAADMHPEGSPKREAYMNRLRELGAA